MTRIRLIAVLTAATFAAGCAQPAGDATKPLLQPNGAHHYVASVNEADSLHVGITGKLEVYTASNQRYTANVSNGTATSYHFDWFTADCLSNCDTAEMVLFAEGDGLSSVSIPFASTNDEKIISVHVIELNGTGRSGATIIETAGPNLLANNSNPSLVRNPCDYYNPIDWYPIKNPDPLAELRRNYCNNTLSSKY